MGDRIIINGTENAKVNGNNYQITKKGGDKIFYFLASDSVYKAFANVEITGGEWTCLESSLTLLMSKIKEDEPIYRTSIKMPKLTADRTITLPDVSGEVITTGNVDVLFGGGDGGRDLSAASISNKLTVKGDTYLGDDTNDII